MRGQIKILPDRIFAVGIETDSGNEVYAARVVDGHERWEQEPPAIVKAELRKAAARLAAISKAPTKRRSAKKTPAKKAPTG